MKLFTQIKPHLSAAKGLILSPGIAQDTTPRMHPGVNIKPISADANPLALWEHDYRVHMRNKLGPNPLVERTTAQLAGKPAEQARLAAVAGLTATVGVQTAAAIATFPVLGPFGVLAQTGLLGWASYKGYQHADKAGNFFHWMSDNYDIGQIHTHALRHHYLPAEMSKASSAKFLAASNWVVGGGLALTAAAPYVARAAGLHIDPHFEPALNALRAYAATLLVMSPASTIVHGWAHRGNNLPAYIKWLQNAPKLVGNWFAERDYPRIAQFVKDRPVLLDPREHIVHHQDHSRNYSGLSGASHAELDGPKADGMKHRRMEMALYKLFGLVPLTWRESPETMRQAFTYAEDVNRSSTVRMLGKLFKGPDAKTQAQIAGVLRELEAQPKAEGKPRYKKVA